MIRPLTRPQRRALVRLADLDRMIGAEVRAFGASPRGEWIKAGPGTPTTEATVKALVDRGLARVCRRPEGLGPNAVAVIGRDTLAKLDARAFPFETWIAFTDEGRRVAREARL